MQGNFQPVNRLAKSFLTTKYPRRSFKSCGDILYTETTAPIKRSRREPPAMQGGKKTLDSRIYKIYKKAPLC